MATQPINSGSSLLENILLIIEAGTAAAKLVPNPEVQAGALIASRLETIVNAALIAHQQATGQPLDLTKLQPIPLIP